MQPTLADSLEVLLPSLPPALVSPEMLPHLRELARSLAPIPHCGFETHLLAPTRVDLQQCIVPREPNTQRLRSHLHRQSKAGNETINPNWRRLDNFLAQLCDPASLLHESIVDLWLEFDQTASLSHSNLPLIFFGFHRKRYTAPHRFARYAVAETALDVLVGRPSWMSYQMNLKKCIDACRGPVFVSYIGLMLARPLAALRVNIKSLSPDTLMGYLEGVGWPGAKDEAVAMMARLYAFVDRITVCLDVGERVHPQIGFECILDEQPPHETRWDKFLDYLVEQGWCTSAKRDALLTWPGLTSPTNAAGPWPDRLLHDALLQPPDHFTTLQRRLSHVKVVCQPRQQIQAKAYFGFLHSWLQLKEEQNGKISNENKIKRDEVTKLSQGGSSDVLGHRFDINDLRGAIRQAISFLLDARTPSDWWYDFPNVKSGSDGWVTAIVGAMLATVPDIRAQQAVKDAWSLLEKRLPHLGGWGFSARVPADADSTAWGLRLATAVGEEQSERAQQARQVLEQHLLPNGGLTCYREEAMSLPVVMLGRVFHGSRDGWCHTAHPCITAGAAVLADERPRDFLRRTQCEDGSWKAYWWEDAEYSTALAAEALSRTGRATDRRHVDQAIRWAVERIGPTGAVYSTCHGAGSAFATAWCVRILTLAEDPAISREPLEKAVGWLLDTQRTNGAWPSSAWLRFTFPDVIDPDVEPPAVFLDEVGVFTTSIVLSALEAARSHLYDNAGRENGKLGKVLHE